MLEFGILSISLNHGTWFSLATCIYMWDSFTCRLSYASLLVMILFHVLSLNLQRRNKAIHCRYTLLTTILLKKEWSNLLLRLCLSIDYWVVNPKVITQLLYWWETSFCLSCSSTCILNIAYYYQFEQSLLWFWDSVIYACVWLFVEPPLSHAGD